MADRSRKWTLADVLIFAGIWLLLIVLSPILLPLIAYAFLKGKYEDASLKRFLKRNEGARFFVYTSKPTGSEFAREKIIPRLDSTVQIIYMSQKGRMNLGDESLINTLIGMQAGGAKPGGYPCVAKVVQGQLVSESLNTEFYRTIMRKDGAEHLLERINAFYE